MAKFRVQAMKKRVILLVSTLIGLFCLTPCALSKSAANSTIKGYVILSKKIVLASAPQAAKVYIYLSDYTPVDGKEVFPWDAPVTEVIAHDLSLLKHHKVAFQFENLAQGQYGVSVLVDTGRPHVPKGSQNFTAFPGDYAGGTKEKLILGPNQTIEVSITEGMYVTIPEGYQAPLFSPQ
jgi:hypothetical protein